jgi:hypothetical protein
VVGIQLDVRRGAEEGEVVDEAVHLVRNGTAAGVDRSNQGNWPMTLEDVTYGGPTDTWGTSWTPTDLNSPMFGLSIAPRLTVKTGNDRAHIDSVHATVFYVGHCD